MTWACKHDRESDLQHALNAPRPPHVPPDLYVIYMTKENTEWLSSCATCVSFSVLYWTTCWSCSDSEEDCDQKSPSVLGAEISLQPERGMVKVKRQTLRTERKNDKENSERRTIKREGRQGNKRREIKTVREEASSVAAGVNTVMRWLYRNVSISATKQSQTDRTSTELQPRKSTGMHAKMLTFRSTFFAHFQLIWTLIRSFALTLYIIKPHVWSEHTKTT